MQDTIINAVCREFRVRECDLFARDRRAKIPLARQVAMYLTGTLMNASLTHVARVFHRDRATVRHAMHKIEDMRDQADFDEMLARLEKRIAPQEDAA